MPLPGVKRGAPRPPACRWVAVPAPGRPGVCGAAAGLATRVPAQRGARSAGSLVSCCICMFRRRANVYLRTCGCGGMAPGIPRPVSGGPPATRLPRAPQANPPASLPRLLCTRRGQQARRRGGRAVGDHHAEEAVQPPQADLRRPAQQGAGLRGWVGGKPGAGLGGGEARCGPGWGMIAGGASMDWVLKVCLLARALPACRGARGSGWEERAQEERPMGECRRVGGPSCSRKVIYMHACSGS